MPTTERKCGPSINGPKEMAEHTHRMFFAALDKLSFPVKQYITKIKRTMQVITAVISGAKFAYPNGVKSK